MSFVFLNDKLKLILMKEALLMNKLERIFGRYAVRNLIVYVLACYVVGYIFEIVGAVRGLNLIGYMTLEPYYIFNGLQLWRLVTWLFIPPTESFIWAVFMFILYYQLGMALERSWGAFRFNVYIFGGIFLTMISAFISYGIMVLQGLNYPLIGSYVSTYYINLSIFLAFSACYPEMRVMLYFFIPIKMKWMAIVYCAIIGYSAFTYIRYGAWYAAIPILASVLNFVIFFFSTRNLNRFNPKEIKRRQEFRRAAAPPPEYTRTGAPIARHKCATCGRTELTNPELQFRFCSKCNGNYEYCNEHLFNHKHVE